jgi:hypothetical protein
MMKGRKKGDGSKDKQFHPKTNMMNKAVQFWKTANVLAQHAHPSWNKSR